MGYYRVYYKNKLVKSNVYGYSKYHAIDKVYSEFYPNYDRSDLVAKKF